MKTAQIDHHALITEHGFELALWYSMMYSHGYASGGLDAITDEPSVQIAEGNWTAVEWDTPTTLHYAEEQP